jgi:hypothetical protein
MESLRYSGFLVCNVLSSLGTVFVTVRSVDAFRGRRVHCGSGLCNFEIFYDDPEKLLKTKPSNDPRVQGWVDKFKLAYQAMVKKGGMIEPAMKAMKPSSANSELDAALKEAQGSHVDLPAEKKPLRHDISDTAAKKKPKPAGKS